VTFCNPNNHDSGEYVRSVFNNFVFLDKAGEKKNAKLMDAFKDFTKSIVDELGTSFFNSWPG
jgi:hypothetical protein